MGGFLFRLGVSLKDKGEQWKCDRLIRFGLGIREFVLRRGMIRHGNIKVY
jgi:hypothetical protein